MFSRSSIRPTRRRERREAKAEAVLDYFPLALAAGVVGGLLLRGWVWRVSREWWERQDRDDQEAAEWLGLMKQGDNEQ